MGFLTGTDATYVDTMYCYGWQKDLTNGWEFKHGVVNTAPIDGLTIVGNDLKIGGSLDKTLIRLTESTPTAEQLAEIERAELPMFQENAKCLLQGASSSVQALAHDPVTDTLTICRPKRTALAILFFKSLCPADVLRSSGELVARSRRPDSNILNFTLSFYILKPSSLPP